MTTISEDKADWFIQVEDDDVPSWASKGNWVKEYWVHVSEAACWCVEDVRYGYPVGRIGDANAWLHVESSQGPRPHEVKE